MKRNFIHLTPNGFLLLYNSWYIGVSVGCHIINALLKYGMYKKRAMKYNYFAV